jgi:hypothetical protein
MKTAGILRSRLCKTQRRTRELAAAVSSQKNPSCVRIPSPVLPDTTLVPIAPLVVTGRLGASRQRAAYHRHTAIMLAIVRTIMIRLARLTEHHLPSCFSSTKQPKADKYQYSSLAKNQTPKKQQCRFYIRGTILRKTKSCGRRRKALR